MVLRTFLTTLKHNLDFFLSDTWSVRSGSVYFGSLLFSCLLAQLKKAISADWFCLKVTKSAHTLCSFTKTQLLAFQHSGEGVGVINEQFIKLR